MKEGQKKRRLFLPVPGSRLPVPSVAGDARNAGLTGTPPEAHG